MQHRILFLIHVQNQWEKVFHLLKKHESSVPHHIVLFKSQIPSCFKDVSVQLADDYLQKNDYEAIDRTIFGDLTKSWYSDLPHYSGIQLGQLVEYDFQKYLSPRIKNLEILKRILEKEKIDKVVVIEEKGKLKEAVEICASVYGFKFYHYSLAKPYSIWNSIKNTGEKTATMILDQVSFYGIRKTCKDNAVLIDAKLYEHFQKNHSGIHFVPLLLGKGLRLRIQLLKKRCFYFSFSNISFNAPFGTHPFDTVSHTPAGVCTSRSDGLAAAPHHAKPSCATVLKDVSQRRHPMLLVEKKIQRYLKNDFSLFIRNIKRVKSLFQKTPIKFIVLRNDQRAWEKLLVLVSKQYSIPSLVIQHGILAEPNGHDTITAEHFAAWGEARGTTSTYWRQKNNIVVTGNPKFDIIPHWKPLMTKEMLCRQLNIPGHKKIIIFVTQQMNTFSSFWVDDLFCVMAEKILNVMKQFPEHHLVIKADPYEDIKPYQNIIARVAHTWGPQSEHLEDWGNVGESRRAIFSTVVSHTDLYTLLFYSDLLITLDSTVALEAMFFNKPVITLNLTKRSDRVDYAKSGAALGAYDGHSLLAAMKEALYDVGAIEKMNLARKRFIEQNAYQLDGKATERVVSLIQQYV